MVKKYHSLKYRITRLPFELQEIIFEETIWLDLLAGYTQSALRLIFSNKSISKKWIKKLIVDPDPETQIEDFAKCVKILFEIVNHYCCEGVVVAPSNPFMVDAPFNFQNYDIIGWFDPYIKDTHHECDGHHIIIKIEDWEMQKITNWETPEIQMYLNWFKRIYGKKMYLTVVYDEINFKYVLKEFK